MFTRIRMRIFASRQCADYARARASYAGAGEARVARVTFAVGEASCLVFVRSIQASMAPLPRRPRPPSPSSEIYLSRRI